MSEVPEVSPEYRKQFSNLRSLMVSPGNVYLAHADGAVWLTDQIVMVNAAGLIPAVADLDDGWYRIVGGGQNPGLFPRGAGLAINIGEYLQQVRKLSLHRVIPTRWSLNGDEDPYRRAPAKGFLLIVDRSPVVKYRPHQRLPVCMNEDVWRSFLALWPQAELSHSGHDGPFVISVPGVAELAYVEPIQIPEDCQPGAIALMEEYRVAAQSAADHMAPDGEGDEPLHV